MTNTTDNTPYAEVEEAVRLIKRIAHWAVDNPDATVWRLALRHLEGVFDKLTAATACERSHKGEFEQ